MIRSCFVFFILFGFLFSQAKADEVRTVEKTEKKSEPEVRDSQKNMIEPYKLSFGLLSGVTLSNATVRPEVPSSHRVGFTIGGYVESPILPGFLYLQPGLEYVQKGAENTLFGGLATTKLSYLEVPVLAKVKFIVPRVRPFVLAGVSLGYLLSGSVEGPGVSVSGSRFNALDFGLQFGGGIGFLLGEGMDSTEVTFTARYSTGLANIDDGGASWKSNVFRLLLGIEL